MTILETTFPFLEELCAQTFGAQAGGAIFQAAEDRYQALLREMPDAGPVLRDHFQRKLYPPLAYYQALRAVGQDQETALAHVSAASRQAAQAKRSDMAKLARLPFAYSIYRLFVKSYMQKNFPDAGWETQWVRCDSREIHFNLRRCVYWDTVRAHGCPELCRVYCENDNIAFSGLLPRIRFQRSGTLGTGGDCCDFHFFRQRT